MKPTRCEKCGKYYDAEVYASCPLCSGEARVMTQRGGTNSVSYQPQQTQQSSWMNTQAETSKSHTHNHTHTHTHTHAPAHDKKSGFKSLFNKKKTDNETVDIQPNPASSIADAWQKSAIPQNEAPVDTPTRPLNQIMGTPLQVYDPVTGTQSNEASYTPPVQPENCVYQPEMQIEKENKPLNNIQAQSQMSHEEQEPQFTRPVSDQRAYSKPQHQETPAVPTPDFDRTQSVYESSMPEKTPLAQAVEQSKPITDSKTVAYYDLSNETDPVVGWLVCIKGEYLGESFKIVSGRNNIGRALTNDIALAQEKTVSRERHAAVIFEPNNKQFFIQPGESSGLTYLNEEMLMNFKELKDRDVIGLGTVKLMFVQLCGKGFSWDSYIN